jgi:hypothetical protein
MSMSKGCEVCGGKVRPIDDQSLFAFCDTCGIVYVLKDRLEGQQSTEAPREIELGLGREPKDTEMPRRTAFIDNEAPLESLSSHWRCPDCDTDLEAPNEADLEFLKREHVREFHPNRSTG